MVQSQPATASRLASALQSGRIVVTAEFAATGATDAEAVKSMATEYPAALDAFVVSADDVSPAVVAATLASQGLEAVLSVLTRDQNRIALVSGVLGAAMLGVHNVLCAPGDHQSLGGRPEAAGVYDVDPVQLLQMLSEQSRSLFIGAEAYPELRPLALSLIDARKKVRAGARFLLTRPVVDAAAFDEWMAAIRQDGLHEETAIIAAVFPATDAEGHAAIAACVAVAKSLKAIEGVRGVHIACADPGLIAEILSNAGLSS